MSTTEEAILVLIKEYGTYFVLNEEFVREYNRIINENCDTNDQPSNNEPSIIMPVDNSQDEHVVNIEQQGKPTDISSQVGNGVNGERETPLNATSGINQPNINEPSKLSQIEINKLYYLCNNLNQEYNIRIGTNVGFGVKISNVYVSTLAYGLRVDYQLSVQKSITLHELKIEIKCFDKSNNQLTSKYRQFGQFYGETDSYFEITKTDNYDLLQIDHILLNIIGIP